MHNEIGITFFWKKTIKHKSFLIGGFMTILMVSIALISLLWTPYSVETFNISNKLATPTWSHWFGTDHFGRDILSMLMVGAWNSLLVSVLAVSLGASLGVPLGIFAALKQGWIDELVMRINDFAFAFPALLTAILLTAVYGPGISNSIIAIGVFNIPVFARLCRGSALVIYKQEYIHAARVAGIGELKISWTHVIPNIGNVLIVQGTIQFAMGILAEAGLSYLGLGTQPPDPSLGKMLSEAQTMMFFAPQLALIPGITIVCTVLGLNLLGDGLRDLLDPRSDTK